MSLSNDIRSLITDQNDSDETTRTFCAGSSLLHAERDHLGAFIDAA